MEHAILTAWAEGGIGFVQLGLIGWGFAAVG